MTDRAFEPPSDDPFEQLATNSGHPANDDDPFAKIAQGGGVDPSSKAGAFGRGLERNILPAVGSFPAIGAGAEMGAAAGSVLGPIGAGVGGIVGGFAGAYLGSTALSSAQNWLLSKAPDSWKEKIGLDDRQEQIDQTQHPYASFLGGLAPYALTMRPGFGATARLPENATALQKIMAHPVTARLFGGAAMGGMELGNEAVSGQPTDWGKVAISTGFGLVWNKPTKIGEAITEAGAKPARALLGRPEPVVAPPAATPAAEPTAEPAAAPTGPPTTAREWNETILGQKPTIAEAADLGVAGPGITEATFQGGHEPNPSATMAAQETARTEQSVIGKPPTPDTNQLARRIEPETFEQYDSLLARRDEFRQWINEYNAPPPELFQELETKRAALQAQLDAHLAERNGYAGGKDARRLRAQIRDIESQHQDLTERQQRFAAGQAEETADLAQARKHLMATEFELRDLLPKIQSAYRRAAEYSGGETYEHPTQPVNRELTTPEVTSGQPLTEELPNVAKPEGVNTPAQEISGEHPSAVAGTAPAESAVIAPAGPALAGTAAREPGAGLGETIATQPAVAPEPAARTIEQQRDYIRNDVARQLIKAGRPKEEAEAAGALEAAYYETRAARFGGKLGTPEELYNREGAEILGPGQRSEQGIVRQPRAPRKIDETKLSLLQFLAHRGGIDAGEKNISDVRSLLGTNNKFVPGFGSLIRKGGMSLDRAREAAVEAGYLHDAASEHGGVTESTINHLLDAMDGELRGQKVYRAGYEKSPPTAADLEDRFGPRPPEEEGGMAGGEPEPPEPPSPLMTEQDYADLELLQKYQKPGNEDLHYLLGDKSKVGVIGAETGSVKPDGISVLKTANAPEGYEASRLVYSDGGHIVGAMQITKAPNGKFTVANTFVDPDYRRGGIATELNKRATELYGPLERSEGPSEAGDAFRESLSPKDVLYQRDLFGESEPQKDLFDTEIPPEATEKTETPQAEAAAEKPTLESTPTEPKGIQDFGEKIEGARKDTFTGFRDSLREEMDVAAEPLSKSFPQPNYEKLAADGVNGRSLAYIAIMRDMIPNKPRRSYKVKQWGAQVETLRSFSRMLLDGEVDPATLDARMKENYALRTLPLTAEAIADIAPADLPRAAKYRVNSASYSMLNGQRYSPPKTFWFIESPESRTLRNPLSNDPANPYTYRETPAEAVALAKQLIPLELAKEAAAPEGQRSKYTEVNLFRDRATGGVYLGLKVRSTVIRLKAGFEDVKAAREYLQENRDDLQKTIDEMRQGPNERGTENRPRTGESLRVGDVSPQSFDSTFGFRGVQFGNYVEDARRQADLNRAYDALIDLADVLGVPPKALSLNGQLGMAFGARGTGGSGAAAAHYEPIQVVINLTKGAGPGSLAHEWLHAVDNYFARQDAGKDKSTNYISANHRDTGLVRDEVYQAWKNVEKTLQSGGFAERAAKFDEARSKPYWNTTIEKAARSFEKYVIDRLDEKGAVNDYLANINTSGGAYPTSDEMQSSGIRAAYDRLFDTIETRNTDRGVELYQHGQNAPPFYSAVATAVDNAKIDKASPEQWLGTIRNTPGVKPEELQWLGIEDWLKAQKKSVTKQQIADYVRANQIEVKEVEKGREPDEPKEKVMWQNGPYQSVAMASEDSITHPNSAYREAVDAGKAKWTDENGKPLTNDEAARRAKEWEYYWKARESKPRGQSATKFAAYQLPGGENYRELLLTLPPKGTETSRMLHGFGDMLDNIKTTADVAEARRHNPNFKASTDGMSYQEVLDAIHQPKAGEPFQSSHFDEPNILSHIRFNDRTIDGKKTLFIEEIQSDWHQKGRKQGYDSAAERAKDLNELPEGYKVAVGQLNGADRYEVRQPDGKLIAAHATKDGAIVSALNHVNDETRRAHGQQGSPVPDAPFKTSWPELALKRMIRYAAENGYDKVAWTPGEEQAKRYDLSKHIKEIEYVKNGDGTYKLGITDKDGEPIGAGHGIDVNRMTLPQIEEAVGKEIAEKISNETGKRYRGHEGITLDNVDLKVGGEGMLGFYDDILPKAANKLVKKFGAKVGIDQLPEGEHGEIYEREGGPFIGNTRSQADVEKARAEGKFVKLDQKGVPVHSLNITDDLRNAATQTGFPLFQGAQGGIVLNPHGLPGRDWLGSEDAKPILRITRDGNASTFIHESGHKYLADLLRDSAHPEAPQDLRDDAATVQHWLGIDSPEALTRKAHEKFARGFEQYLREGTAPSPQLASVFAKFKQWLVSIYQTLKGLGKPINEDIRGVFDRLLAENPQRTVIAPERTMQPTLADIHEADALHTEPAQKEAVQAQVDQERQRAYDEYPHEKRQAAEEELARFYAEHEQANEAGSGGGNPTDRGGPDEPGASGLSEVQPDGGTAESGPADSGMGAQSGAQRQGVSSVGAGSDGLRGSSERNAGSGPESNPLAPNPAHAFDAAESGAVDKAGNIRVENVTSLEGLAQAIHDSAERNGDYKAVRGAMTEGQKVDLANELNLDPSTIDEAKLGQMFGGIDNLAPKIWALRTLLRDSAQVVFDTMRKVKETNSDEDAAAFALAAARHDMIQGTVSKVTAEMGRGLGMGFKNLEGYEQAQNLAEFVKAASGKELFQLKAMAKLGAQLDSPAKVSKFLRDAQKRSFGGMVLEYWINGLISGVATHVTYTAGNTALAGNRMLLETPTAALIGKFREAMGEQGAHVQLGETAARAGGLWRGLPAAFQASLEAARSGVTTLLPGEAGRPLMPFNGDNQLVVGKSATNEPVTWGEVKGDVSGMIRGLRDAVIATSELVKAGGQEGAPLIGTAMSPLGQIPDIAVKGVTVLPLGSAIRAPGRMIAAIHSFFRSANYSMEKAADAYRTAATEGLKGEAFDARVAQIWTDPTEERMAAYRHESTELTLMGQGSKFTQALSKLTNTPIGGVRWLKFVDPFVHIASNVIDQSIIKRTPLGLLSPELRADLMGRPDPLTGKIDIAARDMAQARMLVGSALGVTFAGLASQGYISGSGPKDPRESAMWRLAGNQAHSVRIGDIWYDVHRLGPLGMLLGISADMYDVAHTAAQGDIVTAASHLQHALTQNILDESFMRGPAALIQAIEDPERYGQQYIENTLASFVPFSVGMAQMDRASDPYTRRARSIMDAVKAKVPGLSETLYPKRDIWGNEIPNLPSFGGRAVSAFYEQQVSRDPVNIAMIQLGISPSQVERKIRNIDLDDNQYDDFSRLSGRMSKQRLDTIVRSPDFNSWPNNIKVNVITEVIRQSREAARGMMMMKYPALLMNSVQAQKDKRLGVDAKSTQRRAELNR